jgi:hypothetical protein
MQAALKFHSDSQTRLQGNSGNLHIQHWLFLTGQTFEFSQEVARTWKVEAMPTFVLVKDGKEVGRVIGAKKDELERKIRMFVTSSSSS